MTKRPDIIDGHIQKIKTGCGTLFITVGKVEGKISELFLNGSKLGGCRANQEGLSRLVSLALRTGTDIKDIIDQLELIKCPACTRVKAKLDNEKEIKDFPCSCPDAVSKVLKAFTEK